MTGVQTCALPISERERERKGERESERKGEREEPYVPIAPIRIDRAGTF